MNRPGRRRSPEFETIALASALWVSLLPTGDRYEIFDFNRLSAIRRINQHLVADVNPLEIASINGEVDPHRRKVGDDESRLLFGYELTQRGLTIDDCACQRRFQFVGRQTLIAFDDCENIALFHTVANAFAHIAHDSRKSRRDLKERFLIWLHDAI